MKIILDVPNYEFDNDIKDKFQDFFNRVRVDIAKHKTIMCGNYERETADMFLTSFKHAAYLPKDMTNGDMIKSMFPYIEIKNNCDMYYSINIENLSIDKGLNTVGFRKDWWDAPYTKEVNE